MPRCFATVARSLSPRPEMLTTRRLSFGSFGASFSGESYLLTFALPNFYFHLVTAYDILRNQGVKIGKLDFLGPLGPR